MNKHSKRSISTGRVHTSTLRPTPQPSEFWATARAACLGGLACLLGPMLINKTAQNFRDALERLTQMEARSMLRSLLLEEKFDSHFAF